MGQPVQESVKHREELSDHQSKVLKKRNIINITKRHYLQTADLDTAFRDESEASDTENRDPVSVPFTAYREEQQDQKDLDEEVVTEIEQEVTFIETEKGSNPLLDDLESLTPNGTPIKSLPFSPSLFLNSPGIPIGRVTSTPVCTQKEAITPTCILQNSTAKTLQPRSANCTPRIRRTLLNATPRTPTPFKDAMADKKNRNNQEELDGPAGKEDHKLRYTPENVSIDKHAPVKKTLPKRKMRKCLATKWLSPRRDVGFPDRKPMVMSPETPSKSLLNDASVLFSPPSIIKDTLPEEIQEDTKSPRKETTKKNSMVKKSSRKIQFAEPESLQSSKLNTDFVKIACGRTEDEILMIDFARSIVKSASFP